MKKKSKPILEGEYILLNYSRCDYEAEGCALAVYRVRKGRAIPVIDPAEFSTVQLSHGVYDDKKETLVPVSEAVVKRMSVLKIKEVYTVFGPTLERFGIPEGVVEISDVVNEKGECYGWFEYSSIIVDQDLELLKRNRIKVKVYEDEEYKNSDISKLVKRYLGLMEDPTP